MTLPLTIRQRLALGQSHRKQLRRADHAGWKPALRRADPLHLLAASMRGRVPDLIELKYERMAASPFGFFRGAAPVMASDLSLSANTGLHTQLCGDAHVRNLGAFAGPDGNLLFDLNDFDETILGPFEWDVKRMATSLLLAGREAGAKDAVCRAAAEAFLSRYRAMLRSFTRMTVLDTARFQVHRLRDLEPIAQVLQTAERSTPRHNLDALTVPLGKIAPEARSSHPKPSQPHKVPQTSSELPARHDPHARFFRDTPPDLTRVSPETARAVLDSLPTYAQSLLPERRHLLAQYTPLDIAFKVVGTGSVGLRDYCIYLQGNGPKDPLFLQIKEEVASCYTPYLGESSAAGHQGRRVADGQRAMQLQSDPFLGWTTIDGRDYLVRQLNDHKASVDLSSLKPEGLLEYAGVCGELLARGHARAGDAALLTGYIGTSARFDDALLHFAVDYANQTEHDWKALLHSRRAGASKAKPETKPKHTSKTKPPRKAPDIRPKKPQTPAHKRAPVARNKTASKP